MCPRAGLLVKAGVVLVKPVLLKPVRLKPLLLRPRSHPPLPPPEMADCWRTSVPIRSASPVTTGSPSKTLPSLFPNPELRLLHEPNQITSADFDGWVQERGLYFADEWDPKYLSVLESHDPGEMPLPGGMLYAPVGKGAYIFSAYDWFRELPAGVPGAYRMFANMLSAGKTQ